MSTTVERTELPPALVPEASPAPRRAQSPSLWPLLARLHFYAGILVAPFLVVAAVTGIAYALTPQIESIIYADTLHVSSTEGSIQPIDAQIRAARAAYPEGTLAAVNLPDGPEDTTGVVLNVPDLDEEHQRTVYVDPYTNRVTGELTTWYDTTPVTTWLDDLHRNLHLGDLGRNYSELAASWLWIIVGGGLLMWLLRGRTYRSGQKQVRTTVLPDLSAARGVRRTRGWHAATGVWLVVGLLALSATGLTWSKYAGSRFETVMDGLDGHRAELDTALPDSAAAPTPAAHHGGAPTAELPDVDPADVTTVLATARAAGLAGPLTVAVPTEAGTAWTATQTDDRWPVHKDQVAIDADTKQVTARNNWSDAPVLAKLTRYGVLSHMGILFGPVNQILLIALALGLLCVTFWGYRMWWQRRPTRADRRRSAGTPPARGTWRRLPTAGLAIGVVATVALCWALPLFGWSLVAFVLADLYVAEFQRQRDAASRELVGS
jgi:uncharacterized iron-regulated membrane protein